MKSRFIFLALALFALTTTQASAVPLMWDVGAAGAPAFGDPDSLTGLFDQIGFDSQTSTIQYDTDGSGGVSVGDKFTDSGNLRVNGLIASGFTDEEGLWQAGGYEVTASWGNLAGYVTSVNPTLNGTQIGVRYTSGTIDFYLDNALDSVFANPAGTTPPAGAGGTGFADGTMIAELSLMNGIGHTFVDFTGNDLQNQGSVELQLEVTDYLADFWLNADGIDLFDTVDYVNWVWATTDMNIDTPTQVPGIPDGALYTAYSNQNGSAELTVVPEPSTFILLGVGLAGLGFYTRRRKQ